MVRNYVRKSISRRHNNYDEEMVKKALKAAAEQGISLRKSAKTYGIPYSTLYNRSRNENPKNCGAQPVLSKEEETELVKALHICLEEGIPLQKQDILNLVQRYLNSQGVTTRFRNNRPGPDWFQSFMKRHPALAHGLAANAGKTLDAIILDKCILHFQNRKTDDT